MILGGVLTEYLDWRWCLYINPLSPASNTATFRVPAEDSGVASAMVNTMQQAGQSIGTALLNTLAISATASYLAAHASSGQGSALKPLSLVHGYTTSFWWAAGIFAAGAIICGTLLRRGALAGQGNSSPEDASPGLAAAVAGPQVAAAGRQDIAAHEQAAPAVPKQPGQPAR